MPVYTQYFNNAHYNNARIDTKPNTRTEGIIVTMALMAKILDIVASCEDLLLPRRVRGLFLFVLFISISPCNSKRRDKPQQRASTV